MWTGRTGGFLRQAELVQINLSDGTMRVIASGPMDGARSSPPSATDFTSTPTPASKRSRATARGARAQLQVVGPGYYFC